MGGYRLFRKEAGKRRICHGFFYRYISNAWSFPMEGTMGGFRACEFA